MHELEGDIKTTNHANSLKEPLIANGFWGKMSPLPPRRVGRRRLDITGS